MTRQEAVKFLITQPYKFGHLLGFTKLTELHNEWIVDMLRGKEDTSLQSHRASYKTTCVSIALSLIIILLPNERTLFMRKTDSDVKEVIKQVQNILTNPKTQYFVQCIYNVSIKLTVSNATEIMTNLTTDIKGTSQLVGIGTSTSLTGKHFDRIFTDDIINIQDRISKAERDRTKLVYQELQNIKNRGGRIYNTLTPWHKEDASILMPPAKKYDCYTTGLISKEELDQIKQSMIPSLFAANYELKMIASEDVIFTEPITGAETYLVEQGESHLDCAYGGEDYTALTICKKREGKYYILGKCWHKHIEDCMDEAIKIHNALNCGKWHMETNGDKGFVCKEFRNKGERVHAYHENMNKFLKITTYLKAEWKNVVFVEGTDKDYINQICDYNENAEHDDCPDSCASMIRQLWNKKENTNTGTSMFL